MTALKSITRYQEQETVPFEYGPVVKEASMPKRQVWDRLFLLSLVMMVTVSALFDARDITYHLLRTSNHAVYASLGVLSVLSVVALADVIVNDLLPESYALHGAIHQRQLIWMLIGVTLMTFAYMIIRHSNPWSSVWYILIAVRCVSVAFLDMHYAIKRRLGSQHA